MSADLDTDILAPICVGLFVSLAAASGYIYALRYQKKTITRKASELEKQIVATEQQRQEHLNIALQNYREDIDRQKEQVEKVKLSHKELEEMVVFCIKSLERLNPGWLADRMAGKPEYELIITDLNAPPKGAAAIKAQRPPPPARSPIGEIKTPPPSA